MTKEELLAEEHICNGKCQDDITKNYVHCKTCTRLKDFLAGYKTGKAEQEAQIEKMKNWCNCKNYQQCLIELAEQGKGMNPSECCVNCKKWEIKEK